MPLEQFDRGIEKSDLFFLEENPAGTPPVLLIHGLGATSASWGYQTPVLGGWGLRILALDVPGFGKSAWSGGWQWSIPRVTQRIARFLESTTYAPAAVIGISMGGTIALQLALDYPKLVARLGLVNTFACLRPRQVHEWRYYLRRFALVSLRGLEEQSVLVANRLFPEPEQEVLRQALIEEILQSDLVSYRRAMLALARFNVSHRLREIRIPTLVVTGSRDTTVPRHAQDALARGIPGAKQIVIEGAGHAVTADHPEAFNAALKDFLLPSADPRTSAGR